MNMSIVHVESLTKQFGDFVAVKNLSFELEHGEILGFLGPNGAGKTTTIQMLLGVLTPTSGKIAFFGENFAEKREKILEKVNFSSTYTNLPWRLSVKENLTYISFLYNIPQRKKRIEELVEVFRLKEILNQPVAELSAGQQTRLNLAKAFLNNPKVMLLDEPTASLDPEIAQYIREYLLEKQAEEKISILFTSHNMPEVETICDRVLFINRGEIVAQGTPQELARTLDFCRVVFLFDPENLAKIKRLHTQTPYKVEFDGSFTTFEVKEKQVSQLLSHLVNEGIEYTEISIEKPTLEDFFLSQTQQKPTSFSDVI